MESKINISTNRPQEVEVSKIEFIMCDGSILSLSGREVLGLHRVLINLLGSSPKIPPSRTINLNNVGHGRERCGHLAGGAVEQVVYSSGGIPVTYEGSE